jgi:hypothetical protein
MTSLRQYVAGPSLDKDREAIRRRPFSPEPVLGLRSRTDPPPRRETGAMDVRPVDPRDSGWEIAPSCRVYFWER